MKIFLSAMAVGLAICGSAPCATPAVVTAAFQVGGVDFKLVLPDGYCLPAGQIAASADKAAAADTANATDLTAYKCDSRGDALEQPLLIKTPRGMLSTTVERRAFLAQMGAQLHNPEVTAALASGKIDKSSAAAFSKVEGDPVTVKSEFKLVGEDDTCVYMAGTETIGEGARSTRAAVAACMTAAHGRVLSIYAFGPYSAPHDALALEPKARALALTLIKENE